MNLNERMESLIAKASPLWKPDACGVTRSEKAIPAMLHPDLAWHADGHGWRVEGSHPWSLDDDNMQQQLD